MARKGDGLTKRGNTWWLDCRINGKRYKVRLGKLISRTVAGEIAQTERAKILKGEAGHARKKKPSLTFDDGKAIFLTWAETNTRPNTVVEYRQCLDVLSKTFGTKRLDDVRSFDVERYKSERKVSAPTRFNHELRTMRAMYNRLRALGKYRGENPARGGEEGVRLLKESGGRLRFLDEDEEAKLLAAAGEPLRTILLTAIYAGLRLRSELLSLTWENVDFKTNMVTVEAAYAKNGKTRSVPMNTVLREALIEHRERYGSVNLTGPSSPTSGKGSGKLPQPSSPTSENASGNLPGAIVFTAWKGPRKGMPLRSVRTSLETAAKKAKLTGISPHVLRHTFASKLVMAGVDLRTVQELGGWSSLELVQRYAHLTPEHRREAVERMVSGRISHRDSPIAGSAIR